MVPLNEAMHTLSKCLTAFKCKIIKNYYQTFHPVSNVRRFVVVSASYRLRLLAPT